MRPADESLLITAGRVRLVVRWALGAVLVVAGVLKIAHPADFHSDLLAYDLPVPDDFLRWVAVAFPWLEVIGGSALLAGFWPETVGILVVAMGLIFVLMLGQAVGRGLDLNCGCFGRGPAGWFNHPLAALGRAGLLLAGALWCLPPPTGAPPER